MTSKLIIALVAVFVSASAHAATCPSKPQKIKVIDLKSGWWQGDGGDTDQYVVKHITTNCPNVTFSYSHTLYGGFGSFGSFPAVQTPVPTPQAAKESADFDQIWLLSGAEADGADIRIDSPEFQAYLTQIKEGKGNLFIGAGFGNVYHANAATEGLGLGALFHTEREVHEYPSPSSGLTIMDSITIDPTKKQHPLLNHISSLPHTVKIGEFIAVSDTLASSVNVIARDNQGQTVIGDTTVGTRKLIMDANLARTYLIRTPDDGIQKYLLNLVNALEH